ncbi:hypothetical protein pdam_00013756 [Pocillopora damicornis]|uniref:EGF domain-specific O-linked N-acetylglucosamine transferase n=1 Tax=Pocillopora damicornis TaxID=46731 RepID=A0A3M6V446_POCDA|nr:hypothetical protein pdam_00013756 [Pocillopora damicornis]
MSGRHFRTIEDKIHQFWKESDFGFVKSVQDSLQLVCKPKEIQHARRSLGNFGVTWKVFSSNPILYLGKEYENKRVCFKEAIFALLPRMVFGLYYNTPLTPGCSKSGLFKAFSEHVMGRLGIIQERNFQPTGNTFLSVLHALEASSVMRHQADKTCSDQLICNTIKIHFKNSSEPIRVTLLSRGTKFRNILNENEIIHALDTYPGVKLNVSQYSWDMPFAEQLKRSHNTDIFIGMHGAGLSHALFLPDWANLFELYNCGDVNCYRDLARLRGVSYTTWENEDKVVEHTEELHPRYSDHPKFRNYAFDVREFMRLVERTVKKVRQSIDEYTKKRGS